MIQDENEPSSQRDTTPTHENLLTIDYPMPKAMDEDGRLEAVSGSENLLAIGALDVRVASLGFWNRLGITLEVAAC